jgi:hypothetical protein
LCGWGRWAHFFSDWVPFAKLCVCVRERERESLLSSLLWWWFSDSWQLIGVSVHVLDYFTGWRASMEIRDCSGFII